MRRPFSVRNLEFHETFMCKRHKTLCLKKHGINERYNV